MTLDEILDILNEFERSGVTTHPDDDYLRACNDLLSDLRDRFTTEFQEG